MFFPETQYPSNQNPMSQYKFLDSEGSRYLGGFLGSNEDEGKCLKKKTDFWKESVDKLGTIGKIFPHRIY